MQTVIRDEPDLRSSCRPCRHTGLIGANVPRPRVRKPAADLVEMLEFQCTSFRLLLQFHCWGTAKPDT